MADCGLPRDEYFQRYNSLKELIASGYVDVFCLQTIKGYIETKDENNRLPSPAAKALSHICMLLKSDLCLTIWKAYLDTNQKCNSVQHLRSFIEENFKEYTVPKERISISSKTKKIQNDIRAIRKEFLAHNDNTKSGVRIDTDEMISLLELIRERLNLLCIPEIDYRVMPLSDADLNAIGVETKYGLGHMIYSSCAIANNPDI